MKHPQFEDKNTMSAVEDLDYRTRGYLQRLEGREAVRLGVTKSQARQVISRRIGVSLGTLENVRRGRLKGIREWVSTRIRAALIQQINAELRGLEHERQMVMASGGVGSTLEVAEIDASLAEIRALLSGAKQ